jgi:hypothetical protein
MHCPHFFKGAMSDDDVRWFPIEPICILTLNSTLKDERGFPSNKKNVMDMLPWIREATQALAQLESPEQATRTSDKDTSLD